MTTPAKTTSTVETLPAPPAVSCSHVCLGYNGEWVLHDVNLAVPEGAFLPFVGPNGGGKTTLLRAMLGLMKPDCGEIKLGRADLRTGYVPQQKSIDPLFPITLIDIVSMVFYRNWGWWRRPTRHQRALALDALEQVGLAAHARRNYRELSGGMKQRALIARALASGADILVLDEPTSELDAPTDRDITERILSLNRDQGKTILIACHGLQLAVSLSDRVCLVEHGKAQIVDTGQARKFTAPQRSLDGNTAWESTSHAK